MAWGDRFNSGTLLYERNAAMPVEPFTIIKTAHLIALAVALGAALAIDALFLMRAVFRPITMATLDAARFLSRLVAWGLAGLWITGVPLAWYLAGIDPHFITNEKFWVKVFIVAVLSVNGLIIHEVVLPLVGRRVGRPLFEGLGFAQRLALAIAAGISLVSWLFPVLLATAPELNHRAGAHEILAFYYACLAGTVLAFGAVAFLPPRRAGPLAHQPAALRA